MDHILMKYEKEVLFYQLNWMDVLTTITFIMLGITFYQLTRSVTGGHINVCSGGVMHN